MNLGVAALLSWLATAGLGGILVRTWIARGRASRAGGPQPAAGRPPPYIPRTLVLAHVLLAVSGLAVWLTYVVRATDRLAWTALALLLAVALLGTAMFVRWLGSRRVRRVSRGGAGPPAESRLPVLVVLGHGLLGATTVLLVLAAALRG
jgi:hypothetical protein